MSQIVDDLRQVAIEIKTETQVGGNTAARVGGAFERVADALEGTQQIEDMDAAVAAVQQAAAENEQTIQDIVNSLAVVQTTGQSASDVMSQKAVTDKLNNINILADYVGGVVGGTLSMRNALSFARGVININNGEIVASTTRCYNTIPIEGGFRRIDIECKTGYYINSVCEYNSATIGSSSFVKADLINDGTKPSTFSLVTNNYVVICVAKTANTAITFSEAWNNTFVRQATNDLDCKGLNDIQGAGVITDLSVLTWSSGRLNENGVNDASSYHLRSYYIYENGIIELYAGEELYIESVFIYDANNVKVATIAYNQSLERCRYNVESGYISRAVIKRKDGAAMDTYMGDLMVCSHVQSNSRIFNVEEKADKVDTIEEMLIGGGDEVAITLHKGGFWNNSLWALSSVDGYSYSDAFQVQEGQKIKVTLNVGVGAYGVWGCATNVFSSSGVSIVGISTEVHDLVVTIPQGVNYIFISSRNEDFSTPFTPSAYYYTNSWIDKKIEQGIEKSAFANPFYGLKLVTLGDSITHGQVIDGTPPSKPFPVLVAEELGMTLVNYGIGGSTIGTCANYGGTFASLADFNAATKDTSKYYVVMTGRQTYTDYRYNGSSWVTTTIAMRTPLVDRYDFMDADADIILVAGGTNDFQYNWADIGEITDTSKATFKGALNNLCSGLITKYPQKCIIFMTPIKRCQTQQAAAANSDTTAHRGGSYGTIDSQNDFGKTLKDYGDIIKEMCARYSIPVIDMYAECLLNPQLSAQSFLFDSYKTHPYQAGHDMMARLIVGKLKSIFGAVI